MVSLTKDAILGRAAQGPEAVDVPEWGGSVAVRMLTGTERDALFAALQRGEDGSTDMHDFRARLVSAAVVGEDGPMFTHAEVAALDDTQPTAVLRLFTAAQRINKLRPGDLEDVAKN